jgi:hypothetical protein
MPLLKTVVPSHQTASPTFAPVPSATLTVVPTEASVSHWLVMVGAKLGNSSGTAVATELQYRVDGSVVGAGGARMLADSRGPFQHFVLLPADAGEHEVTVDARAAVGEATVEDLTIVALPIPTASEPIYVHDDERRFVEAGETALSMTLEVDRAGAYLILVLANAVDSTGGDVHLSVVTGHGPRWPDPSVWLVNGHRGSQTYLLARAEELATGSYNYELGVGGGGEVLFTRMIGLRLDGFQDVQLAQNTENVSTATPDEVIVSTLTTVAPGELTRYFVLQTMASSVRTDPNNHRLHVALGDGDAEVEWFHVPGHPMLMTYSRFDLVESDAALELHNVFSSPDGSTVFTRESAIVVLGLD